MTTAIREQPLMAEWPIDAVQPNPLNPRQIVDDAGLGELAESIRSQGILQPLLVTPDGTVIAGHRRLAAAQRAGLATIPVIVREMSEQEQLAVMLVENLQREDLTPLQEARAYARLTTTGTTIADLERMIGVGKARIRERLTLLKLDADVAAIIDRRELPPRYALELAKVTDVVKQKRLALICLRRRLTLEKLREIVADGADVLRPAAPKQNPFQAKAKPTDETVPIPADLHFSRTQAIAWLTDQTEPLLPSTLAVAVEDVCCACGMSGVGEICGECPLPQFVRALMVRVG